MTGRGSFERGYRTKDGHVADHCWCDTFPECENYPVGPVESGTKGNGTLESGAAIPGPEEPSRDNSWWDILVLLELLRSQKLMFVNNG